VRPIDDGDVLSAPLEQLYALAVQDDRGVLTALRARLRQQLLRVLVGEAKRDQEH